GLERVFEFTNTTSSCDGLSLCRASGSLKWIESTIAWRMIEMDSAIASTRESGSSLASGCGHARALETLNFLTPKSFANHSILGSFSSFVLRILPSDLLDAFLASNYAFTCGFNELSFID